MAGTGYITAETRRSAEIRREVKQNAGFCDVKIKKNKKEYKYKEVLPPLRFSARPEGPLRLRGENQTLRQALPALFTDGVCG
jgi:hypothetical protein